MALAQTEQPDPRVLAQAALDRLAAIATLDERIPWEPSELARMVALLADAVLGLVVFGAQASPTAPAEAQQDPTAVGYL